MHASTYRFAVYNDTGVNSTNVTLNTRGKKFDSNGGLVYDGSETELFNAAVNTGTAGISAPNDNRLWGVHLCKDKKRIDTFVP